MNKSSILFLLSLFIIYGNAFTQVKIKYKESKSGYYQKEILKVDDNDVKSRTYLSIDSDDNYPTRIDDYEVVWHNDPVSQGATGTCWCFATISFLESEIFRINGNEIKLSEMYIVYWEYVERAKSFIENRGEVYFAQGSEATSVTRIMKKYGIVPLSAYSGKTKGQRHHNHSMMFKEMYSYLIKLKEDNAWNTGAAVSTIRSILDHYMGPVPERFDYKGKEYTPLSFLDYCEIKPDDYFSFMSTMSQDYNQKGELIEADNWWHCDDYYNLDIDDYYGIVKNATDNGYSISICGDISEPGFEKYMEVAIIPEFDIPAEYINEESRELRLYNKSTTDDHCIHIVGYFEGKDGDWFLIKDSNAGAFDGINKGYRFMHEDYVRLKMMNIMVYKEAASFILDKIIK